jgi:hypothetical protein
MSEHENELKKALAENGNFDAERASCAAATAGASFHRRLKLLARITWLRILILVAVAIVGLIGFIATSNSKATIGFAALALAGLVAICVVDLQYRITNTKVSLLKEMKFLRLECLGHPSGQTAALSQESDSTSTNLWRTAPLSLREDTLWYGAMILVALAGAFFAVWWSSYAWPFNMARFEGTPITVEAPRVGAPVYYTVYIRMEKGVCKVSRVTPEHKQSELFWMGKGFVSNGTLPPGDSLRLDPQGNKGEYWVRFE